MEKTLFIADDSPDIIELLIDVFSKIPNLEIVGTAETIKNAKESIKILKPDIIILDFQFENGTGLEILKFIRVNNYKSIVLFFTNYGYSELKEKCLKEGADYFFKKITESKMLIKEIKKIIKK